MGTTETIDIIKNSFEAWYNKTYSTDSPVSIAINYSDVQTLLIKAYHKVTIKMVAVGIKNGLSYTVTLLETSENYNHGVTSEEEAKQYITQRFLTDVFEYCSKKPN